MGASAELRISRTEHLREILLKEKDLTNKQIQERMPWVTRYMLTKVRKETGISVPTGLYLTRKDFKDRSVKVGSKFPSPYHVDSRRTSDKASWDRREEEARRRREEYEQEEENGT